MLRDRQLCFCKTAPFLIKNDYIDNYISITIENNLALAEPQKAIDSELRTG